jgi:hypothetical protein
MTNCLLEVEIGGDKVPFGIFAAHVLEVAPLALSIRHSMRDLPKKYDTWAPSLTIRTVRKMHGTHEREDQKLVTHTSVEIASLLDMAKYEQENLIDRKLCVTCREAMGDQIL